jgi:hypothetical protein
LKDNIKMDLQQVGWAGMDCIDLVQDTDRWQAFVTAVMNPWVPQNVVNFSARQGPNRFSRTLLHGVTESEKSISNCFKINFV